MTLHFETGLTSSNSSSIWDLNLSFNLSYIIIATHAFFGLSKWHSDKELSINTVDSTDVGLIPGLGRSPGVGNNNQLQYSGLENSLEREAWWARIHAVTKSQMWLSTQKMIFIHYFLLEISFFLNLITLSLCVFKAKVSLLTYC